MDIKINGNLQMQNEYKLAQSNLSTGNEKDNKRVVLERNKDAFLKVAGYAYDKNGQCNIDDVEDAVIKDGEKIIADENKSAKMLECIDTLKSLVTPEDYSQLEEWGLIPEEDNPESFVSVYERIQIQLAAYCDDYNMTGLNVNKEKMRTVLGSESMTNALARAKDMSDMGKLNNDAKKYIIENNLNPTLENVYKAVHSGTKVAAKPLTDDEWQQLSPQVEKLFEINGIEKNSENLDCAKWIISEKLPLNVENLHKLTELNKIDFSDASYMKQLEEDISYTVYFGSEGMEVDTTLNSFDTDKITEAVNTVQSAMDSDVDYILKNNRKLNVKNLKERIAERQKEEAKEAALKAIDNSHENIRVEGNANRILIEARAVLTSSSLFMMQKAGVNITYTEITVMVDISYHNDNSFADSIYMLEGEKPVDEQRDLLSETMRVMNGFANLPLAVAGKIYTGEISYTAKAVYDEGNLLKTKLYMAAESYETVGTKVRADLGDKITKAFRNIDDILAAEGIELTDDNRRAARILGYNSMEITVESVQMVGNIANELYELTKNMTPKAALYLIRNGINPLNTNINELNEQLIEINKEIYSKDEDVKYSEYLWKLEKRGDILPEERDAYIQLYRILEHINREDGRAAGAVTKAGANLTLANLYSAVKTQKVRSIDKKVDDDFGLFDGEYSEDALTSYMEKISDMMEDDSDYDHYRYERMQEKIDIISHNETMSEQEFMRVVSGMEGTGVNNIYTAMIATDSAFYKRLRNLGDDRVINETSKITNVWENNEATETEEQIVSAYVNLKAAADSENTETTYERAITKTDIKQAVSFMARQAQEKSYYVPMEIAGDMTMIHMTFKQADENGKGKISIYTETIYGKISVLMTRKEETYERYIATDSVELKEKLQKLTEGTIVLSKQVKDGMWSDMAADMTANTEDVSYGELVREAKYFIHNVLKNI